MAIVIQGQKADGTYGKVALDDDGRLQTSPGFTTSTIEYYPVAAALTWETVTPASNASKLTILNAATDKYTLIATEKIHKAQDGTLPLTQAPPFSAGAQVYAGAIEMQLDQNTHAASTTLHKAAGQAIYPVHKVIDETTITATNPATNDTTELYALADEVMDDFIVHIGSTTYHVAATGTITHTAATTEATAVTETNLIRTSMLAHYADAANHGGVADAVNLALVTATSACTDKTTAVTLINLLATYHLAHLALGGAADNEARLVAQANAIRTGLLEHYASTAYHYTADTVNLALVNATTIATNAATALTLMNALATPYYAHLGFYQREKYAAAAKIEWYGQTPLYVALESAGGFTVRTES